MKSYRLKKENKKTYDRYLVKDVTDLEIRFKDGKKANLKNSAEGKVVVMKVYSSAVLQNTFKFSVIENYSSGIQAAELSDKCGYTCFRTFQRHFKKHFNDTVYSWILKHKMEDIRTLVINTDMPMTEISKRFSFKHTSHFANAYKKHYGITPSKEREQALVKSDT